ncbi:farnesol dehydrogenase-like isoform X2 [Tribolium madens]|uniref:farnesol dehydrogenase-like isoform X2 n=1 Tax=Tribolium madens TaxID=41895 RepID=UPI001CF72D11|nr:farnesol dehydrogenase-like isoform X2 [Tribolium madens]
MERWEGKIAIVTGASTGIGAATSKILVQKGLKVVGLARRVDLIEELTLSLTDAPGELYAVKCDLTKEEEILEAFKWVKDNLGPVHILVNNAGFIRPTNLLEGSTEDWRLTFDVNVMAMCICTREAVKVMRENNIAGHVINMNSVVGRYPVCLPTPTLNVYPASKYAVTALTENMRQEMRYFNTGIKVTSISPGIVISEFQEGFCKDGTKEAMRNGPVLYPEDVADAIIYTLSTPPHVQVHDIFMHPLGEMI